jgi:hypothetical protein
MTRLALLFIIATAATPTWSRAQTASAPGTRVAGLVAFDPKHDRIVVYGGMLFGPNANPLDADPRTYAWDGRSWSVIAQTGPRSRDEIAYGVDPRDGSIILVNGRGQGDPPPAGTPGPPVRQRIPFRETWTFNGATWARLDTLGPEGGASPQAAFDVARGRLVFFGGAIGNSGRGALQLATWEWDGKGWKRFDVPGPPGRTGHVMAYDAKSHRVIMHGGVRSADRTPLTDTWAWDGKTWKLLTPSGPRTIFGAAASDPDSGIVIFGGHQMGSATDDTFYWNGSAWSTIAAKGPSARTFNGMTTDVGRKRVYVYGGSAEAGGASLGDLWYLENHKIWVKVAPRD